MIKARSRPSDLVPGPLRPRQQRRHGQAGSRDCACCSAEPVAVSPAVCRVQWQPRISRGRTRYPFAQLRCTRPPEHGQSTNATVACAFIAVTGSGRNQASSGRLREIDHDLGAIFREGSPSRLSLRKPGSPGRPAGISPAIPSAIHNMPRRRSQPGHNCDRVMTFRLVQLCPASPRPLRQRRRNVSSALGGQEVRNMTRMRAR